MTVKKNREIKPALQQALQYLATGQLQKAEQAYRDVLSRDRDNVEAHHYLGVLYCQTGQLDRGIASIRQAIAMQPGYGEAYKSLGKALTMNGQHAEAIGSLQKAIAINPQYAEAYNELGSIYEQQEKTAEAVSMYQKALDFNPSLFVTWNNLGNILREQEKLPEAEECYRKALAIRPDIADIHTNLGKVQKELDRFDEAIHSLTQALTINPNFAKAHFEMGNVYLAQVNYDAAGACFQKALSIDPEFAEAHNNVGIIFLHFDYFKEAKAHFEKALSLNPKSAETHHNIGRFYLKQGKLDQSIQSLRKAISLAPESASIFSNLIFILNYTTAMTQEDIYMESIAFDRQYSGGMVYDRLDYANEKNKDRKLRIGYMSPDFRDHSVAYFFEPVLKNHNRKQFDVFCYDANAKKQDQVTRRLQDESDLWVAIPRWKSERVAERVKADRIDILIDLAGHSANNSLLVFARKPAPVQVTWLGYPNTTGLRAMDYRITDKVADPVGEADNLYSEQLSRLEHGFLCYQPDPSALDIASPPCMTEKYVTFGSFNNLSKITPEVVKVWATILTMVKESRLILKSPQLVDPEVQDIYRQMFAKQNIASDRIELFKMLPDKRDHFSLYNRVDIGLDPFPYNGTTTTCEALWMGVPVVTLRGNRHSGRVGASIIHGVGLDELVTGSIPAYIDLACSLAQDKQRLSGLRKNLRGQMQNSKLMDANLFVDSLESTFRQMWVNWCEQ